MPRTTTNPRKTPELKIVFDTNALHTKVAHDLVRKEFGDLVMQNLGHTDLKIAWLLPEIVIQERQYQMMEKARELLPSLEKIEALLGHKLGISADTLHTRVDDAIRRKMSELKLEKISLDATRVDWSSIMRNAAFRNPPFERGEKEKGFRDALIAETFLQLVEKSPKTPSVCRIVLVTNDSLLKSAVKCRIDGSNNTEVLGDLEEVRNLISILVSEVTEEFVSSIKEKASSLFFDTAEEKESLYVKEDVYNQIVTRFKDEIEKQPNEADFMVMSKHFVLSPQSIFVKKETQRLYFATRVHFIWTLFKNAPQPNESEFPLEKPGFTISSTEGITLNPAVPLNELIPYLNTSTRPWGQGLLGTKMLPPIEIGKKSATFEVLWSFTVSRNEKLTAGKVNEITHIDTSVTLSTD